MKLQYAIVIGAILVGSIATVNWAFISEDQISANSFKSTAGMMGHVTLTAYNENGDITAYQQTDNVVINAGDNCLLADTFHVGTCGDTNAAYSYIQIGTSSDAKSETSTALAAASANTAGTVALVNAASEAGGAVAKVTAQFFDVNAAIGEAALRNGAGGTGDVLALQAFNNINLGATDDLTIEWSVTIDGN